MDERLKEAPALNPANLLTLLRLVLVPVFAVYVLERRLDLAFLCFGLAALTDWLDGWVARRYGWVTALGVFIDPLADKALQLTAFTLLAVKDDIPDWMAVLAWSRELLVVTGFTLLALVAHLKTVRATWLGKLGTLAQMGSLALYLGVRAFAHHPAAVPGALMVMGVAVLINFSAGLQYAIRGFQAYEAVQRKDGRRA